MHLTCILGKYHCLFCATSHKILEITDGIHDLGGFKWELLISLFAAWVIVFLCLFKGVKTSGKVVYVTATVPYLFLTILLIRGVTLPGSLEGVKYFIIPDFKLLLQFKVCGLLGHSESYTRYESALSVINTRWEWDVVQVFFTKKKSQFCGIYSLS